MNQRIVKAPWNMQQVFALAEHQMDPNIHPYTCHIHTTAPLIPTNDGWVCVVTGCLYSQDWAHRMDTIRGPRPHHT